MMNGMGGLSLAATPRSETADIADAAVDRVNALRAEIFALEGRLAVAKEAMETISNSARACLDPEEQ